MLSLPHGRRVRWAALALCAFVAACGGSQQPDDRVVVAGTSTAGARREAPRSLGRVSCGHARDARIARPDRRLFSARSVWNRELPESITQAPELAARLAAEAKREIAKGTGPWIQTTSYSTPLYTVGPHQRCVRVKLDVTAEYGRRLKRAFTRVPLPSSARPAAGTDAHLTLWQPSTDSLWEFWKLRRSSDGWHAAWGGAMQQVSRSAGYYETSSWPGATPNWGATATSLPAIAGTMTVDELKRGRIDHALAISVPDARAGVFAFPARRTDGTLSDPGAIPEGARFRLDPRVDVDRLDGPAVVRTIARAAQRYGLIVRDKTGVAIGFFAEDPAPLGHNPYPELFGGRYPSVLLARLPWARIQAVKPRLRRLTW